MFGGYVDFCLETTSTLQAAEGRFFLRGQGPRCSCDLDPLRLIFWLEGLCDGRCFELKR